MIQNARQSAHFSRTHCRSGTSETGITWQGRGRAVFSVGASVCPEILQEKDDHQNLNQLDAYFPPKKSQVSLLWWLFPVVTATWMAETGGWVL